jgi:hypothetical protein
MRALGLGLLTLLGTVACARPADVSPSVPSLAPIAHSVVVPAASAQQAAAPAPSPKEQLELEQPREPAASAPRELPRALPKLSGVRAPALCAGLAAGPLSTSKQACGATALSRLADALDVSALQARDRALAPLEACSELPEGWLRAARAELARECADVLIAPALRSLKTPLDAELGEIWLGLALAARFGRSVEKPPLYLGPGDDDSVGRYMKKTLRPWKERQLERLGQAVSATALLEREGYGATVVAIARARATHELYSSARRSRIPAAVAGDYHFRTRYYAALDAELEDVRPLLAPADARVAELLLQQGIHRAFDADDWYWQQRRDFLQLRLLPPPSVEPASDIERIARSLPSPYVEALFGVAVVDEPRTLRLMVEHGLTPRQRRALWVRQPNPAIVETWAYFEATLALRTRRLGHFDVVVGLLRDAERRSPAAELLLATARSMRTGQVQRDAQTGEENGWLFDLTPLQALAELETAGRARALALSNAAWLSLLANTPPAVASAEELFRRASALAPTEACLRQRFGGFIAEHRGPVCDLPGLP